MLSAHEDFTDVLVDGLLAVACGWDVLDDDCVIGMLGWDLALRLEKL